MDAETSCEVDASFLALMFFVSIHSFANVAQKLNTKLATPLGRCAAWRLEENAWLKEVPTMVIGLSTASGAYTVNVCFLSPFLNILMLLRFFQRWEKMRK
jgi:hypothetical protein